MKKYILKYRWLSLQRAFLTFLNSLRYSRKTRLSGSDSYGCIRFTSLRNVTKKALKSLNPAYFFLIAVFIQFLFLYFSPDAYAHKVSTYAYREGDKVFGECYFVDGSPCKNSKVEVYDSKGRKITETMTDEKGRFSFKTSETGELKIVIPAGEGHRAEYRLEAVEKPEKKEVKKQEPVKEAQRPQFPQTSINKEELKQIIDEAMDAKLQGLRGEMMDLRKQMDRVSLRDVIGGIGYILGVWGIIMFLKRKKNAS